MSQDKESFPESVLQPQSVVQPQGIVQPQGDVQQQGDVGDWHRLHPLSPLVRLGAFAAPVLIVVITELSAQNSGQLLGHAIEAVVVLGLGVVSWFVTRWRIEGNALRIEKGLLRRNSLQYPLARLQAIDTVRPLLARIFGLAELRLRMAGAGDASARLAYLPEDKADQLRARLLAIAHGKAENTPAPPERVVFTLLTGRLLFSLLLSATGLFILLTVLTAAMAFVFGFDTAIKAVLSGGFALYAGLILGFWQKFNSFYGLTVAEAPDGLRLRSGLLQMTAETIPTGRVQALRVSEPFLWRRVGWCRVEVDIAGKQGRRKKQDAQGRQFHTIVPVGKLEEAFRLIDRIWPNRPSVLLPPPPRARWKSPLRFRFLSYGMNEQYAVTTSGRLKRITDIVPLGKVQSIRRVQGPVQLRLNLATVHLDTAGRNVRSAFRDRDATEADELLVQLMERCRAARHVGDIKSSGEGNSESNGDHGHLNDLSIRPCTYEDIEQFAASGLSIDVLARHQAKYEMQTRRKAVYFLAWQSGRVVGFVTLLKVSKYEGVRKVIGRFPEMNDLEANPQRMGIGTKLIAFAEEFARSHGSSMIGLGVNISNPDARRLYERLGYSDWGQGIVIDEWFELDEEGKPATGHSDECHYLLKEL